MALSYSVKERWWDGFKTHSIVDITLDASYVTGGWALDKQALGMYRSVDSLNVYGHNAEAYYFELTRGSSPKLVAKTPAQTTGATAVAAAGTGAKATDATGAETVIQLPGSVISTTYKDLRSVEAATNEAFLNSKVVSVEAIGF